MKGKLKTTLALLCLAATAGTAAAQNLIGPEVDRSRVQVDLTAEQSLARRYRLVEVSPEVTSGATFHLSLFPGDDYIAHRDRIEHQAGIAVWAGRIEGHAQSSVVVATHPSGIIFARIDIDETSYVIEHKERGVHAVFEVDPSRLPSEDPDDGVADPGDSPEPEGGSGAGSSLGKSLGGESLFSVDSNPSVCTVGNSCADQVVDVMVVYTADAKTAMGGAASTETAIAAAVTELNTTAANGGLGHTFRLALARQVTYTESGNIGTDINRLGSVDGVIDEIHTWRDSVGADLVHMVVDVGGCGIGNLASSATGFSSSRAFSVSDDFCFRYNRTFPHELGHNMGLRHDRYMDSANTPCSWAHGYVNQEAFGGTTSERWRTVMAYNNQCSASGFNCTRLPYYSNPLNTYTSDPMGIDAAQADAADAAQLLDRSICVIAGYRDAVVPPPSVDLEVSAYLEGAWNGSGMTASLGDYLPADQPYSGDPWLYAGTDSVPSVDVSGEPGVPDFFEADSTIVDWVLVELRSGVPPATQTVEAQRAGLIHTDGSITDLDGVSDLTFDGLSGSAYYVVVYHRNHLAVLSASAVDFSSGTGVHDFRSSMASAYSGTGDPMVELDTGVFGMLAGDADADKQVTAADYNAWLAATKSAPVGYFSADLNLDGQATVVDFNDWLVNTKGGATSQVPD